MIHVCYALHDTQGTFAKFLGTSMASLLANTQEGVHIHLLHDATLSQDTRAKFVKLVGGYEDMISFYHVTLPPGIYNPMMRSPNSPAALYRLAMGDILPPTVQKLVYLDADTIIKLDIAELWQENLGGAVIGAIPQSLYPTISPHDFPLIKLGKISAEKYFNSGILLIDLNRWRHLAGFWEDSLRFLCANAEILRYSDQDILNVWFSGNYHPLPMRYNLNVYHLRLMRKDYAASSGIYHYAGWCLGLPNGDGYDTLFWEYFIRTPWFGVETMARYTEKLLTPNQTTWSIVSEI